MLICVHTAASSSHGRAMGGRCKNCQEPTPTGGRQRAPNRRRARHSPRRHRGHNELGPLGAISQDPSDGEALTPRHLLTGGSLIAPPALRTPDQENLSCLRRWRLVSSVRQAFWQRWSREYVLWLQIRGKWHERQPNLEEGDLVIVAEDNLPPQEWLVGRVIATHEGEDGMVRVVEIRTSTGAVFRRAIHKLAPLPMC
ncbi:uncharacterized protein LOC117188399 [Drosophila miranda]|uniref:uncharacterized protein LOC117188399 n=1 Tax=Drosophila miranda TaxID=7229 RepID=UPI00143F4F36|nr:uncharacterized protein LOC117188399 [Drosophila miranda]